MVARDPVSKSSAKVNRLIPQTPEEQAIYDKGAARREARKLQQKQDLQYKPPTEEERLIIHDLWLQTRNNRETDALPDGMV